MRSIQEQYERIRYPHYVHPLTDPARLAALGRILGLRVANPNSARVLDVGCGSGTNLLAMAEQLPGSRFLGIDFAAPEIAAGQALAEEAGLANVKLEQADLLTWKPAGERYDYIIAYGLFSWVLVGPEAADSSGLDANALSDLCFKPELQPDGDLHLDPNAGHFVTGSGLRVALRSAPLVAFARALATRREAFTAYSEVLSQAQSDAGIVFTDAEESRLLQDLLSLYVRRQLNVSALAFAPPAVLPWRPRLTPLNAATARHRGLLVNAFHEASRIGPAEQALCNLLDGTRDQGKLRKCAEQSAAEIDVERLLNALRRGGCLVAD